MVKNEKLNKAKTAIRRLDYSEICALETWIRKRREDMGILERAKKRKKHDEFIKSLPAGTMVVFTDSRFDLCGEIGVIKRHLGRNSPRTAVDFGRGFGVWHVPRHALSNDTSREKIKQLMMNKKIGRDIAKAFSIIK